MLWQLVTPANWNAVEVEEILTRFEEKFNDLPMKIKFVRNGSLVIMTTVSAEVFKESSAFQSAVKAFLTRMVEICHIDTHMSCNVDVTLHILESDKSKYHYIILHYFTFKFGRVSLSQVLTFCPAREGIAAMKYEFIVI